MPADSPDSTAGGGAGEPFVGTRAGADGQSSRDGAKVADPNVFTTADAVRVRTLQRKLPELSRELGQIGGKLQGAQYEALTSNPDFKARQAKIAALQGEIKTLLASLPERARLDGQRDQHKAARAEVQVRIAELERRIADARAAYAKARAGGTEPPVDENSMRAMLTELGQLQAQSRELQGAIVSHAKDVKKLELESRASHPEISPKAAQLERLSGALRADLMATKTVAALVAKRDTMQAERRAAVAELSELTSRSNRVTQAAGAARN